MNETKGTSARNAGKLDIWLQNADVGQFAQTATNPAILPQTASANHVCTVANITQNQLNTIMCLVPATQEAERSSAAFAR